jgi:hypothetical protein
MNGLLRTVGLFLRAINVISAWLNVPYLGQVGYGADEHHNDCGPTSGGMVIKFFGISIVSIDVLFNEVQPSGDAYTSFGDICKLWDVRGIGADYDQEVTLGKLYEYLIKGVPIVALIRYGALESIRPNTFKGSHFVVIVGMDLKNVYIHDPLNNVSSGELVQVPLALWNTAWSTLGDQNPQRSCLIPSKSTSPNVLKIVYPKDTDGCSIRSMPGVTTTATYLYAIPYDKTFTKVSSRMLIYEIRNVLRNGIYEDWGRIHESQSRWVCLKFTVEAK